MAEAYEVFKQFEYKNNSNLVLQREGPGPNQHEPTGEPESLAGKLLGRMGDKAEKAKPPRVGDLIKRRFVDLGDAMTTNVQFVDTVDGGRTKRRRRGRRLQETLKALGGSALDEEEEGKYADGAHPPPAADLMTESRDEPVAVVFDDRLDEDEKDALLEEDDEDESVSSEGGLNEDDANDEMIGELNVPVEEDIDIEHAGIRAGLRQTKNLVVSEIGSHWLQREIKDRGIVSEADLSLHLIPTEKEILEILQYPDLQQCESGLLDLLGHDHFDFTSLLLWNRWKVVYMTRLGQAQTDAERDGIRLEMSQTVAGQQVLDELELSGKKQDREKVLERDVRAEAADLAKRSKGGDTFMGDEEEENSHNDGILPSGVTIPLGNSVAASSITGADIHPVVEVRLPEGTERVTGKDYDEIHIPMNPQRAEGPTYKVNEVLPEWCHSCFTEVGVKMFNVAQSAVFETAFKRGDINMLVCAPTGAGKTNVAMLAMLNIIAQHRSVNTEATVGGSWLDSFKIIYVSPMKALVAEQVASFQKRLDYLNLGLCVRELTGDMSLSQREIEATQIIVTTPEKWDVATRHAGERTYTRNVKLMIIDEIHLLHDNRGPVLETLVARMLRQGEIGTRKIRLIGLSATLPNYEDVGIFLRVPLDPQKGGLFVFGSHYRPVPLAQTFIGVKVKKAMKRYELMNELCYKKVSEFGKTSHQVLVFVHSRKETARTAKWLKDQAFEDSSIINYAEDGSVSKNILTSERENCISNDLKELLPYGFGIHHAGMDRKDRQLVEALFANGHIKVLVSTATLAWGVNLPAHAVIIKGTQVYSPEAGKWIELPPLDVVQMMGRAGRPPYDKFGHGIIITQQAQLQYHVSLINQQLPIESKMLKLLPEILNSEIVLGTIRHRQDAAKWLLYTYLFIRMSRAPEKYGIPTEVFDSDPRLMQRRVDLAHSALLILDSHRLINYDRKSGTIQTTALGRAASLYYLSCGTVGTLNLSLTPNLTDIELLRIFSIVKEFSNVPVRPEERVELQKCMDRVPLPIKGQLNEPSTKINVLLQAYISRLRLDGFALQADMSLVQQNATRIMRAIFEISVRRGWAKPAELALLYSKCIERRMWSLMTPLRQFGVLSLADIKKIESRNLPWSRYYDLDPAQLGELVKNAGLGKKLHKLIHHFPKLDAACYVLPITSDRIQFDLTITPEFLWNDKLHRGAELFYIFVENVDRDKILYSDTFVVKGTGGGNATVTTLSFSVTLDKSPNYFIIIQSDRWIGGDLAIPVTFNSLVLPAKNPQCTNFLGLQPLPISAINYPEAEVKLYAAQEVFNSTQTQVFSALFSSDQNVLLCAPPTSGRVICAEFAILRMIVRSQQDPNARLSCVCIMPTEAQAKSRHSWWHKRFGEGLGLHVAKMEGNLLADLQALSRNHIIVCTPQQWEATSRRWKTRKAVQSVTLIIVDSIHMLNDPLVGSTLEVCISRSRYISAMNADVQTRFVGIGNSVADAKDIADWMGVETTTHLFNFHPSVRKIPLDLAIHRIDLINRTSRITATYMPLCNAIKRNGKNSVIIVATDRKEARQTAIEILLNAASDAQPTRYRHVDENTICALLQENKEIMRERILGDLLRYGVGITHEGMKVDEVELVYKLYEKGWLQILIVTHTMIATLQCCAQLVIIQDTEIYDARKKRWTHYTANTIMDMLGKAESSGSACAALIFCKPSRHEEIKRAVFDPIPVESSLDLNMGDHLLVEIVTGTVKNKQEAIDWLTWTFSYRRIAKNPNYYGLKKATSELLSDFLSEQIENAIECLQKANCIRVVNDMDMTPLNLGLIACFYSIRYGTIDAFNKMISETTKHRHLLTVLSAAMEIADQLQIRAGEEGVLQQLYSSLNLAIGSESDPDFTDVHIKALILLTAHLKRIPLTPDLQEDLTSLLVLMEKCGHALVDTISSNGWLKSMLAAMETIQMITQACLTNETNLCQLPHITNHFIDVANKTFGINDVFEFINMEDDERNQLFQAAGNFTEQQIKEIAQVCNSFPILDCKISLNSKSGAQVEEDNEGSITDVSVKYKITQTTDVQLILDISREQDDDEEDSDEVYCPYFPTKKLQQWWVLVGHVKQNRVLGIKKTTLSKRQETVRIMLDPNLLAALLEKGEWMNLTVFVISDSYIGFDQELPLSLLLEQ